MKTSFITFLATLATFQTAISALPTESETLVERNPEGGKTQFPAGLPDGLYVGDLNEDGTTKWTLVEPHNLTARADLETVAAAGIDKRQGSQGVHCAWNDSVDSNNRAAAITGLANYCGPNGRFFSGEVISYQVGNVVAYGCNYRGRTGTTCWKGSTTDRLNQVSNTCGKTTAGWYSLGQGHSSYGYTNTWTGFC